MSSDVVPSRQRADKGENAGSANPQRRAVPRLRLAGNWSPIASSATPASNTTAKSTLPNEPRGTRRSAPPTALRNVGQPITAVDDPRWVLALRTAESLEGATLMAEKRERLLRIGTMMGLSVFDASLVIAIVQDQARRGYHPDECPTAAEGQLTMIPLPQRRGFLAGAFEGKQAWWTLGLLAIVVAIEAVVIWNLLS